MGEPSKDHPQALTIRAAWQKGFSASIDVFLPAPHINFHRGIVADNILLGIKLDNNPRFIISGGIKIHVNHQPDPLDFKFTLTLGLTSASVEGALRTKDGWKDPFGISDKLVIGGVDLKIGILYETFLETGPNEVGFAGSFVFGDLSAGLAFLVEEVPSHKLLLGD
jgi:hypothetical protein